MRLHVYLLEGAEWSLKESYVKLKVGKYKSRARVLKDTENPIWKEEFVFRVRNLDAELVVSVYKHHDQEGGLFNVRDGELVGRVKIPIWSVVAEENQCLPPTWFSVERPRPKNAKSTDRHCGKLLLGLSLQKGDQDASSSESNQFLKSEAKPASSLDNFLPSSLSKKALEVKPMRKVIAGYFEKLFNSKEGEGSGTENLSEPSTLTDNEETLEETSSPSSFLDLIELLQSKNESIESPENLQGGILLDETYVGSPKDLNMAIFAPNSEIVKSMVELQGTTDYREEAWIWKSDCIPSLRRVVEYTKPATKLVKAVKATEEQAYLKADGKEFAILVNVSTPDAPYGSIFKIQLLYKIMPVMSSGEESSHLVVSWVINFSQSTMVRGMIEGGARQGLKENFEQLSSIVSQKFKKVGDAEMSEKDHILATMGGQKPSVSAVKYFWNFTVISMILMLIYTLLHIFLCEPTKQQGLEFEGLDLPDSLGALITGGLLAIQVERVFEMVFHFVGARLQRGSDHGVKAQGEGWILTIALVEGSNLASIDPKETPDPYVVFTCNGRKRTSSVKLQTLNPQWNEILEFDAIDEPPSLLEVEVFNFEGPFDQASCLGRAEINFVKLTAAQLADLWVPLEGKLAQTSQAKLHLRIFLDNNNGVETIRDYLSNLEKEVGKKLNLRSPHRNSNFQKIFGLPPEEFLISDFSCSLKRKMPLQGRLFLSARIVGFYANLFGHRTTFFFLWEDIASIQVLPPSISSVGSPSLLIMLHKGRGLDARHGAKTMDNEGKLHFYFHSFVNLNVASRTIMALWRTRSLDPDQRAEIAAEQQMCDDEKSCQPDDARSYAVFEDAKMTNVYSEQLPMDMALVMKLFDGGDLEHRVMSKSGCQNYVTSPWEHTATDVQERRVCYKFNRRISIFGGEVNCTQQKLRSPDSEEGWVVNEVMAFRDVPFSEHFRVQLRYQIEKEPCSSHNCCQYEVHVGIMWLLRSNKFAPRISKNVVGKFSHRVKEILQLLEREVQLTSQ